MWKLVSAVSIVLFLVLGGTVVHLSRQTREMREQISYYAQWQDDQVARYHVWVPDHVWKDADAVYFVQVQYPQNPSVVGDRAVEAWMQRGRERLRAAGFSIGEWHVLLPSAPHWCEYCVLSVRIPEWWGGKPLPHFLEADPPNTGDYRVTGCGWLKGRK